MTIIALLLAILFSSVVECRSSDIELSGETKVEALRFNDGSLQLSATLQGPQGIQGIQGIQGEKGDKGDKGDPGTPAPVAPERVLYINRLSISDFQPIWFHQGAIWQAFNPAFALTFNKLSDTSILRVEWSDNVGIYSNSWCNIGLFVDDEQSTNCSGSWSGVSGTSIFNQQFINCVISGITAGTHVIAVKHRSQYCVFGNYAFDNSGLNRYLSVEEQN